MDIRQCKNKVELTKNYVSIYNNIKLHEHIVDSCLLMVLT